MDPNKMLADAQAWIAFVGVLAVAVAGAAVMLAKLYSDTRKKLHAVLVGVEAANGEGVEVKKHVEAATKAAGVDVDDDIAKATGRMTRKFRRAGIGLALLMVVAGCAAVDLRPTVRIQTKTLALLHETASTAPIASGNRFAHMLVTPEMISALAENVRLGRKALAEAK